MIDPREQLAAFAAAASLTHEQLATSGRDAMLSKDALILLAKAAECQLGDYAKLTRHEVFLRLVMHARRAAGADWISSLQDAWRGTPQTAPIVPVAPRVPVAALPFGPWLNSHPMFPAVCKLIAAGQNVALVGPAGTGKTTLARDVARQLGRTFGSLSCSAGASESQVTGWLLPINGNGSFSFVSSQCLQAFETGNSLFLFDEKDAADPNFLVSINAMVDMPEGQCINIPQRFEQPAVARGPNCSFIASMNTFGTGANAQFVGRNPLDEATRDRYYIVEIGYNEQLEAQICAGYPQVLEFVLAVRACIEANKMRRSAGTRMMQRMVRALSSGARTMRETQSDMLAGWTVDEIAKLSFYKAASMPVDPGARF